MSDQLPDPIPGWHYGLDPQAAGLTVVKLERVRHRLGVAMRVEMANPLAAVDERHVQWFIATRVGPWALWAACTRADLAAREAVLADVTWFGVPTEERSLAELRA